MFIFYILNDRFTVSTSEDVDWSAGVVATTTQVVSKATSAETTSACKHQLHQGYFSGRGITEYIRQTVNSTQIESLI